MAMFSQTIVSLMLPTSTAQPANHFTFDAIYGHHCPILKTRQKTVASYERPPVLEWLLLVFSSGGRSKEVPLYANV